MSEEWKALTDDQKLQYQQASDREKEKYNREMRAFKEKLAKANEAAEVPVEVKEDKPEKVVGKKRSASDAPKAKAAAAPKTKTAAPKAPKAEKKERKPKKEEAKHEETKQ